MNALSVPTLVRVYQLRDRKVLEKAGIARAWKPLIVGDTDAGVAYYSRQLGIDPGTLRRVPIELYRSSLYIAFSRDSDDALVAAWAAALAKLRSTGELTRIQRRYERRDDQ